MKKKLLIIGGIIGIIFIIIVIVAGNSPEGKKSFQKGMEQGKSVVDEASDQSTQSQNSPTATKEDTWHEILFDIGEWDKNNGETTTQKFQITSDKWRIKWAKRATTMMSIEVFDSNDKPYGSLPDQPFTFDFGKKEGILDFEGSGTYYVRFKGGTNESAGVWEIRVEELK